MKALNVVTTGILSLAFLAVSANAYASNSAGSDSTVVAQTVNEDKLFDRLETSLIYGLSSDVIGVLESSLFNSVNYKVVYPNFAPETVIEELRRVALEGSNHSLRYKAYLALSYYKNPGQFDSPDVLLSLIDSSYQNGIFFYLQEKVQEEQFTSNE